MAQPHPHTDKLLKRRYRAERRFKALCIGALSLAVIFLVLFFADIISKGYSAFQHGQIKVAVTYNEQSVEIPPAAVGDEVRPLVSRGFLRSIPEQVKNDPDLMGRTVEQWVTAEAGV
ncbi:MAG TPA: DUF3333 domain-containing protein, partial [Gammaproteobacteria bacterium]|nr:DUF3333 domain-containing protein [Gammaproteobacteria bacterium]